MKEPKPCEQCGKIHDGELTELQREALRTIANQNNAVAYVMMLVKVKGVSVFSDARSKQLDDILKPLAEESAECLAELIGEKLEFIVTDEKAMMVRGPADVS